MNNPTPTENKSPEVESALPTPLRCLTGSLMAGGLTFALYNLTSSISQNFADRPLHSNNPTVLNISVAVRTLVVGMSTLAMVVFGIVAIALIALTIQSSIQQLTKRSST
ncbi:DUF3082 domain-containing protein [Aliterella atlantica]|uniref:DUF3082 domain-containing protein n=1 Tax=Aliterella atlantica TaxID=1827278 RepID=UPI0005D32F96|nr:DUF3082 domain-containing protein [Aliterella atlantica]